MLHTTRLLGRRSMQSARFQGGHLRLVSLIQSVTEVCVFRDCGVEQWAKRQIGMKIKNRLFILAHFTFTKNWQDK